MLYILQVAQSVAVADLDYQQLIVQICSGKHLRDLVLRRWLCTRGSTPSTFLGTGNRSGLDTCTAVEVNNARHISSLAFPYTLYHVIYSSSYLATHCCWLMRQEGNSNSLYRHCINNAIDPWAHDPWWAKHTQAHTPTHTNMYKGAELTHSNIAVYIYTYIALHLVHHL